MKYLILAIFCLSFCSVSRASEEFLNASVAGIVTALEEHLGIDFGDEPIIVEFDDKSHPALPFNSILAHIRGKIIVHNDLRSCDFETLSLNIKSHHLPVRNDCDLEDVREVMSHELGHIYTARFAKKYVPDSWMTPFIYGEPTQMTDELYPTVLMTEGIGQFFGSMFSTQKIPLYSESVWTDKYGEGELRSRRMQMYFFYGASGRIVQDIFNNRGVEDGLRYILKNELLLAFPDLSKVVSYIKTSATTENEFEVIQPAKLTAHYVIAPDASPEALQYRLLFPYDLSLFPRFVEVTNRDTLEQVTKSEMALILVCNLNPYEDKHACTDMLRTVAKFEPHCSGLTVGVINAYTHHELLPAQPISKQEDEETGEDLISIEYNPFQFYYGGIPVPSEVLPSITSNHSPRHTGRLLCGQRVLVPAF